MNKELIISNTLKDLGVAVNLSGYKYLKEAISLAMDNSNIIGSITKIMYPVLANKFGSTPARVERAMRHAIESGWLLGDKELQDKLFRYTVNASKGKPTNSAFVATIADYLTMTGEI